MDPAKRYTKNPYSCLFLDCSRFVASTTWSPKCRYCPTRVSANQIEANLSHWWRSCGSGSKSPKFDALRALAIHWWWFFKFNSFQKWSRSFLLLAWIISPNSIKKLKNCIFGENFKFFEISRIARKCEKMFCEVLISLVEEILIKTKYKIIK